MTNGNGNLIMKKKCALKQTHKYVGMIESGSQLIKICKYCGNVKYPYNSKCKGNRKIIHKDVQKGWKKFIELEPKFNMDTKHISALLKEAMRKIDNQVSDEKKEYGKSILEKAIPELIKGGIRNDTKA